MIENKKNNLEKKPKGFQKGHPAFFSWEGKKLSEEHRKKLSRVHTGVFLSEYHKKSISLALKGKKKSAEHIKKASLASGIARKGKCYPHMKNRPSEETKRKMSKNRKGILLGSAHHKWIQDRTKVKLQEDRNNPEYKQWSKNVRTRDNWKCQIADENCHNKIEVHHILSWSKFPELRYKINNGITLCRFHHPRKREDEIRLSPYFQNLVDMKVE